MNQTRRKLLNAVLYFASNTKRLTTTKLSKLLFFLDFNHFKEAGFPSIGLEYNAFENGPVPKSFWLEIKDGKAPQDFKDALFIRSMKTSDETEAGQKQHLFLAKAKPNLKVFSPRERKILSELSEVYRNATAAQMSEITHLKNSPWDQTRKKYGANCPIDYRLALDSEAQIDVRQAEENLIEFFGVQSNFGITPTA